MVHFKMYPYVRKQTTIAACLIIGHIVIGFTISWSAPMIPMLRDSSQTPLPYVISETEASLVGSLLYLGSFGTYIAGYLSNRIGRRHTLILGSIVNLIAYFILTWPKNLAMIYIGRVIIGFSTGFTAIINMVYIGEIASPNIRGIIMTSTGVFHGFGIVLGYSTGSYVSYTEFGYIIFSVIILQLLGNIYIPESPVYYLMKGNKDAAKDVLCKLGRDSNIDNELKLMTEYVENNATKANFCEIFTLKSNRKAFLICVILFMIQNSNGMVTLSFFATTIFEDAGSFIPAHISTIIMGVTSFFGTIVAPIFIERCGRKILLIVSTGCGCLAMTLLGAYFYLDFVKDPAVASIRWLPLVSLMMALFTFSIGLSIIPNTLTGEMFLPNVRGTGSALAMSVGWFSGFLATSSFGYLTLAIGSHGSFWLYAAINLLAVGFTVACVPETRGKSLMEIEEMMER